MSPRHDLTQFRQAAKEVGLSDEERYEASEDLHAEKASGRPRNHMSYGDLLTWLRQWQEDR
jgi:hypothetical protein